MLLQNRSISGFLGRLEFLANTTVTYVCALNVLGTCSKCVYSHCQEAKKQQLQQVSLDEQLLLY